MVMITHTGFLPFSKVVGPLLGPWMLPVFAYLGGLLMKDQKIKRGLIVKRIKILLGSYLLFGTISFVVWVFASRSGYPMGKLELPVADQLTRYLFGIATVFNGPLWFLPCYLLAVLFTIFLRSALIKKRKNVKIFLAAVLFGVGIGLINFHVVFPFGFDVSVLFVSIMFFASVVKTKKIPYYLFLISLPIFLSSVFMNGTTDLNQRLIHNPFLYSLGVVSGITLVTYLFQSTDLHDMSLFQYIRKIGNHSMLLLSIHWPIIQLTTWLLTSVSVTKLIHVKTFTLTSFELPSTPMIRLYIFLFLAIYLSAIFFVSFIILTVKSFIIQKIQPLWKI